MSCAARGWPGGGEWDRVWMICLAVELGAVDRYAGSPADGVTGADLIIIATPVSATLSILREILPHLAPGAVVTDVGSTKAEVVRAAENMLPPGISFVGGHPMAGSEHNGVGGADPYLFENAFYLITPTADTRPAALEKIKKLAVGVGAKVVEIEPERHDLAVAAVSHLPHLLAAAWSTRWRACLKASLFCPSPPAGSGTPPDSRRRPQCGGIFLRRTALRSLK